MTYPHLDRPALELLAAGQLDPEAVLRAKSHLFVCKQCQILLRREVPEGDEILECIVDGDAAKSCDYDEAFDRLEITANEQCKRILSEQGAAPALAEELLDIPKNRRAFSVRSETRFQTAAIARQLLDRTRSLWTVSLEGARERATLALSVAERVTPESLAHDLQARSWSYLGNIHRLYGDFEEADLAFTRAEAFLLDGTGDPLELASLLDLQASLFRAQRDFGAASVALSQVARIYRRVGDLHLEGRALFSQAQVCSTAGKPEDGIPFLIGALERIDLSQEPSLLFAAFNNLLVDLIDLDRLDEAEALLPRVIDASALGTQRSRAHFRWAEAKLHAARGRFAQAELELREAQQDFMDLRSSYNTELIALDLAHLYLLTGRIELARELAAALHQIFVARGIHREAFIALHVFLEATAQDT